MIPLSLLLNVMLFIASRWTVAVLKVHFFYRDWFLLLKHGENMVVENFDLYSYLPDILFLRQNSHFEKSARLSNDGVLG